MESESVSVIILGMHRSGTSSLAGSLQQHGLFLGRVVEWSPHNPKGNRENEAIMLLNEAVLKESGGTWYNPPETVRWNKQLAEIRDTVITPFVANGYPRWGFKDPRTIFTLPFWKEGLREFSLVGIFRSPLLVAQSLHARTPAMSLAQGLTLWKRYNEKLLAWYREREFPLISFDGDPADYHASIERTAAHLGLDPGSKPRESVFFDESLKKQRITDPGIPVPEDVSRVYGELVSINQKQFSR
jgi:hypothetical protein